MSRNKKPHKGFVLLMTILMIAIAGLLMAGIARYSLRLAVESVETQEDLQRRWGAMSCRRAMLAHADAILHRQSVLNRKGGDPLPDAASVAAHVTLGDITFDLLLADETAKVSLNMIHRRQGREGVEQIIQKMAQSHGNLQPRLRPYRTESNPDAIAFDSWGQVFTLNRSSESFSASENASAADLLPASTGELTCWGEDKLNLERATDDVIERAVETILDSNVAQRLIEIRGRHFAQKAAVEALKEQLKTQGNKPNAEQVEQLADQQKKLKDWLNELTTSLGLRGNEQSQLTELVTDRSTCYSLWLTMHAKQRSWQQLCIRSRDTTVEWKERSFLW